VSASVVVDIIVDVEFSSAATAAAAIAAASDEAAFRTIAGTARQMGLEIAD
jgi:ribosomal protein L11